MKLVGITPRQEDILEKIIREHMDSAKPVSSKLLKRKYKFSVSPATIRIEMQILSKEGYLFQPHTSAGRIPTDRGYRFFVDQLLEEGIPEFPDFSEIEKILEKKGNLFKFVNQLTKFLVKASSNFAISYLLDRDFFFKEGWEEVLKEPEFEDEDFRRGFAKFLESFEKRIKDLKTNSGVKVFIGKENPFEEGKSFSMVLAKCNFPKGEKGLVSILGPKRMAYQKNIGLLNLVEQTLGE